MAHQCRCGGCIESGWLGFVARDLSGRIPPCRFGIAFAMTAHSTSNTTFPHRRTPALSKTWSAKGTTWLARDPRVPPIRSRAEQAR
jgi:hypothetical protein